MSSSDVELVSKPIKKRKRKQSGVIVIEDTPPRPKSKIKKRNAEPRSAPLLVQHCTHAFPDVQDALTRRTVTPLPLLDPASFWNQHPPSELQAVHEEDVELPIGSVATEHPLIASSSSSNASMWTIQHAPASASQVLGDQNRDNAIYLRDWMSALALKASSAEAKQSKRKIVRQVDSKKAKRRKKAADSDLDDFIVSDEEEPDYDGLDASPEKASSSSSRTTRFDPLTNLILLQGPHASGKTSSVYAVAKELGWQVHEVNPGSTRRAYRDLLAAVGEVGRNHTMTKRDNKASSSGPIASIFKTAIAKPVGANGVEADKKGKKVEQSVILIEEVDVLFTSDKSEESFWDGVIQIVAGSLRPVILTCTDSSRVPKERLAFQTTLFFDSPPINAVTPYLQALAHKNAFKIPEKSLEELYAHPKPQVELDCPPSLLSSRPPLSLALEQPLRHPDLRQTLTRLQFWCGSPGRLPDFLQPPKKSQIKHEQWPEEKEALRRVCRLAEAMSSSDLVDRNACTHLQAGEYLEVPKTQDQELGYNYLDYQPHEPGVGGLADYVRDEELAEELTAVASRLVSQPGAKALTDGRDMDLAQDRHAFLSRALALSTFLPVDAPLLLEPACISEYLPFMLEMVRADDANEHSYRATLVVPSFENAKGERRSKRLNNDLVEAYHRHLRLGGEEGLENARAMMLSL